MKLWPFALNQPFFCSPKVLSGRDQSLEAKLRRRETKGGQSQVAGGPAAATSRGGGCGPVVGGERKVG